MSDTSDLNIANLAALTAPAGPSRADDRALFTTGTVYEVDSAGAQVRVGVLGGTVWLPAIADRYSAESLARVMVNPYTARPVLVAGAVHPRQPAVLGTILSGPSGGNLTVKIDEQEWVVPAPMGAYTVGNTAWVMLDEWGTPFLAVGPSSKVEGGNGAVAPPVQATTEVATATIGPQASATWSTRSGRWDNWNTGRYGGASDIYQGEGYASGKLIGFAGYGDQIANLGALSIDEIILRARKTDTNGLSAALTVQGSSDGSRPGGAPAGSGDTASSGAIGPGGWGELAFTAAMREAFRTGAQRGLVAVGGQYGAFGGTGQPGSFVLQIRYTRNV